MPFVLKKTKGSKIKGKNKKNLGLIIHSARGIIFSGNPAEEAQKLRDEINQYR